MFKRSLFLLFITFSIEAQAQYKGFELLENPASFKTNFTTESKKIESIKSDFSQEKNLTVLSEKILSSGKFNFKRANQVRIEYQKPYQYLLIMNGDRMLVRDQNKESVVNIKSNKIFQQVNRVMVDCVQGTILENKDFSVRVFQNAITWLLEMTPQDKSLIEFFQTILVYANKQDYSVDSIDMREPSGDYTLIRFTQKELNVPISSELFVIH